MLSGGAVVAYDNNMSPSILLLSLCLLTAPFFAIASNPSGYFINCGANQGITVDGLKYIPDSDGKYIKIGNSATITKPDISPLLTTLRYFPDAASRKFCYSFPVTKNGRYLLKTVYYYGNFDGKNQPPVFDQIVEGTRWSIVNTTDDYAKGLSSYYEVVLRATGRNLGVCVARNKYTGSSSPFISTLDLTLLDSSVYKPTDFDKYALVAVARHAFGSQHFISFPDDQFNRMWQPYKEQQKSVVKSQSNVSSSDFWNLPPAKAFSAGITTNDKTLEINWPTVALPASQYYISLYFQDNRIPSPDSWRIFDVSINENKFFSGLNATTKGVTVYGAQWPLSGHTKITLTSTRGEVAPVINAGEVYQVFPLGGRTRTRDVIAMEDLAKSIEKPPADWKGDPCLPQGNSWIGVTCTNEFNARVISLNLTNAGLAGSLPASINNLSALNHLWLGGNKFSGHIPDLGGLKELETLHLEKNNFEGSLPASLNQLPKLREVYSDFQAGNSAGKIPIATQGKLVE
ncbi:probable LRR receptor-like serine/threonine-protein kinase PAM74 [Arachis duranensis]|uniref:Probable LRR receptor-like serine/threonine-protein kinase PAM74 n=1 Tax=Arachis duranensis TaxID=130453 RepID=A0A6P4BRF9_ARADU|nr:probable LRR receptor-like serine/threonine-protein kinase PAM74 [Arachis duranensis]